MPSRRLWSVLFFLVLLAGPAFAGGMPVRRIAPGDVANEYIVTLQGVAPADMDRAAREIAAKVDGQVVAVWKNALTGFWVRVPAERANLMFRDRRVSAVEQNATMQSSGSQNTDNGYLCNDLASCRPAGNFPADDAVWHLARIGNRSRTDVSYRYQSDGTYANGTRVPVYVVDGGVLRFHQEFTEPHIDPAGRHIDPDESPRVIEVQGSNMIANRNGPDRLPSTAPHPECEVASFEDVMPFAGRYHSQYPWFEPTALDNGITNHGMGVGSLVNGRFVGVAKGANIIPVKVNGCSKTSTIGDVIAAADWILTQERAISPRRPAIVSFSLYRAVIADAPLSLVNALEDAIRKLTDYGIVVVAAANNQNDDACKTTPARLSRRGGGGKVITVGGLAKDADKKFLNQPEDISGKEKGSNWGRCVDLFAPAEKVLHATTSSWASYDNQSSGTSYSAPIVSGIVARLIAEGAIDKPLSSNEEHVDTNRAYVDAVWARLSGSATRLPEVNGSAATNLFGKNSPNAIAYIGSFHIDQQPQSIDTTDATTPLTVSMQLPAGISVCRYVWYRSTTGRHEGSVEVNDEDATHDAAAGTPRKWYWVRVYTQCGSEPQYVDSALAAVSSGCAVITEEPRVSDITADGVPKKRIAFKVQSSVALNSGLVTWYTSPRGDTTSPAGSGAYDSTVGFHLDLPLSATGTYWARIKIGNCITDTDIVHLPGCAALSVPDKTLTTASSNGTVTISFAVPPTSSEPIAYHLLVQEGTNWTVLESGTDMTSFVVDGTGSATYRVEVNNACTSVLSDPLTITAECSTAGQIEPAVLSPPTLPQGGAVHLVQPTFPRRPIAYDRFELRRLTVLPTRLTSHANDVVDFPTKHSVYRTVVCGNPIMQEAVLLIRPKVTVQPADQVSLTTTSLTADARDVDPAGADDTARMTYVWYRLDADATSKGALVKKTNVCEEEKDEKDEAKKRCQGRLLRNVGVGTYFMTATLSVQYGIPTVTYKAETSTRLAKISCRSFPKSRAVRHSEAVEQPPVSAGTAVGLSIEEPIAGASYQWYAGAVGDISTPVASGSSVTVTPLATTTYWARATSSCDPAITSDTDPITITVQCDPIIYTHPESREVSMTAPGTTTRVSTTVVAGGGGPFTYRWYVDGSSTPDPAQTGPTFHWDYAVPLTPPDRITRTVRVDVLSTCGGTQKVVTSRIAALTLVNASQRIFAYSPGDTVYGSRRARLYVVMDPAPSTSHVYSYEWFEDDGTLEGSPLAGNGSQMLVDVGERSTFWCRVTGTHTVNGTTRTEVSISKKMYVWRYGACELPPLKVTQSQYRVADDPEQKVVFTAVCDWPYAEFQWYAGQSGDTRQPIASDPNQPHQLTIGTGPVGPYWVRVSMECGYHEDGPTMTYERGSCGPLLINQNIASVDVEYGGTATLSVDPPAGATQYEWFQERYAGSIETTTVPQLTLPNVTESSRFYAVVSGSSCQRAAKTFVATVRVASCPSLSFLQTPMDMWVTKGVGGTLSVVANGATTYTWFIGEVGDDSQPIPGATSSSLAVNPVVDTKYWVRVSNGGCDIDSPTATVKVCTPPAEAAAPGRNVNIQLPGQWVAFDINMLGTDLAYQWYRGAPGDTSTPIGPAVNRLEDWPAKTTSYWVKVTGRCGTYQSQAFTASLCPRITSITAQPPVVMPNQNQTSTLSINAGTDPLLTYQWYSGPVGNTSDQYKVPNGTGPTLTTPVINAPATFWCYVKSGECFTYSDPVTINLCSEPTVRWQQGDKNVTKGSSVWFYLDAAHSTTQPTVTVYAGNKGDTSTKVYGPSTNEDFTLVVNETRKYWARAQVNNCWSDSEEITVRVCIPTITNPAGGNYTVGGTPVPLSITSDIVPQNGYEWFIGEKGVTSNPVPNSNSASITVTPPADTKYWVRAKGCTNVDSEAALVTVCVPAKVKSHVAVSQWIKKSATKELWVEPEGTGATVRWYRGGLGVIANPVGNATSAFVSPTDTTTYWARVTASCGTATADTPLITVNVCDDPAIAASGQPVSQTIFSGARATLTVTATQSTSTAMTYQWYRGTTSGSGTLIEGATSASYVTDPLTAPASYWVKVRASQSFCETNSSVATVSICPYAQEINAPADKDIAVGGTARLDLNISPVPQSYKWYRGAQGVNTTLISTASYVDVTPTATTQYWAEVTKDGCTSKTRTVTVYISVPTWSQPPSSKTVNAGTATQLTAGATPSDVTYQWYEGTSGSGNLVGTGPTLNIAGRAAGSVANFWVKVTGSRGHSLTSDTATVTWCTPPDISVEPPDASIRRGATTSLTVTATGTNLNYQWYRGASGITTYPVGTNSSTLSNLAPTDTESYWVNVSSPCSSVADTSRTATVYVCYEPTIQVHPLSQKIYNNTSVRLTVSATSNTSMPLSYQWYEGTSGAGTVIPNATNSYYDTPALTTAKNYYVVVKSGICSTVSNTAAIGICAYGPTVNAPADYYIFSGKQTLLKASISPVPSSGSWYRGAQGDRSVKISSQTQVYVYPETTTQYWAEFVGSDGCKTMTRTVTVNVCVPTILEQPQSTTIPYGSSTTLSVTAREGVTYQWWKNDVPISGATSTTLDTGAVWGETYYQVVITGSCGVSVNSAYATVGVY